MHISRLQIPLKNPDCQISDITCSLTLKVRTANRYFTIILLMAKEHNISTSSESRCKMVLQILANQAIFITAEVTLPNVMLQRTNDMMVHDLSVGLSVVRSQP